MTARIPDLKQCLAELIATPSVSSEDKALDMSNRPVADKLAGWLTDLGFLVTLMPLADDPGKVNLIASSGPGEGGLVLSGHTDTVPFDADAWHQDPFTLTERAGRFYGLGTSDMKGFFALVLDCLVEVDRSRLVRPLHVLATCDEESTMAGARALKRAGAAPGRFALIGEPTGLRPVNLHKGVLFETIRLMGRAGHASNPALGVSALDGMYEVIGALRKWHDELVSSGADERFSVPAPTLNFGSIHGGDSPNRICAECVLKVDIRFLPGMNAESVRAGLRRAVLRAIDGSGLGVEFLPAHDGVPPMETPAAAEIVACAERLTGHPAGSVTFGTEGPYFNAMGMETVVLGPGDIDQAHQADEYLSADRIVPMQRILTGMIAHFCLEESGHAS